jgi:hypothetical protein
MSFKYARTAHLRKVMVTQRDHIRSRNWCLIVVVLASMTLVLPSIMTLLFIGAFFRLAYVLWRWSDALERRTEWRNSLG